MRWSQRVRRELALLGGTAALLWIAGGATQALASPTGSAPVEAEAPSFDPAADSAALEAVSDAGGNAGLSATESDSETEEFTHDLHRYPSLEVPTKPWSYSGHYIFGLTRGLSEEEQSAWGRGASMVGTVPLDLVGLPAALFAGLFGS